MAKQRKRLPSMPPLKLVPCCDGGGCGFWNVAYQKHPLFPEGKLLYGSLNLQRHLVSSTPLDKPLRAFALRKPDPGYSFPLMKQGGIKDLEETPCREWREFFQALYKLGYRHVRFHEDTKE